MTANASLGRLGEEYVASVLRSMGYDVVLVADTESHDLLIGTRFRVEVKSALETERIVGGRPYPVWQFSLRRHGLPVDEDLVVLCCYDEEENPPRTTFVIPGELVDEGLTKIDVTTDPERYAGRWAWCANRWVAVDAVIGGVQMELPEKGEG